MAKYNINNNHISKRTITLGDCSEGDIVSIPTEGIDVGIITDECGAHGYLFVVDLGDGTTYEIQTGTACRLYTGTLEFDRKDFEEFCE